jgi:signal transduction histidine kinase
VKFAYYYHYVIIIKEVNGMSSMLEDTTLVHLEALRVSLHRLKAFPLPVETRAAVEEAIQRSDKLAKQMIVKAGMNRLEALYRVSQVLGTSLDLNEVLNQVMDAVIELTGAERGFLMLVDPDTDKLDLRAARNIEHVSIEKKDMEVSQTVIQTVLKNGEAIVSTDAQRDPRFAGQDSIVFFALRSIMCAPLRAHGQVIGVIYVDNRAQTGIFTNEELDLLSTFATQATIAIENARLYTRTDQALSARVAELETLSQIDRELSAHLDFNRVVDITRQWAISETGATRCLLIHKEPDLALNVLGGSQPDSNPTLQNNVIQAVRKALEEESVQTFSPTQKAPARLVVPVVSAGEPSYAIVVERPEAFGDSATKFLMRLSVRAAAALENARLYQAVQTANTAKTKFVSVVTHELRIPMTSIKGYTDLIRQGAVGPITEMQSSFLNTIRNNVDRMTALVSDLSDISHIETGRLKLSCSNILVKEYIQETVNSFKHRLEEKNQTLDLEVKDELPQVYADPNRLVQVLTNLINNANKYTPAGGHITIKADQYGDSVRIEVVDNGIGINEEDQKKLFTQFFRSENETVREQQGWGLGLNLAKYLVELMGGEIGVESEPDKGSTFWFTIPNKQSKV